MPPTDQAVQSGTAKVEIYTRRYCGYCVHAKQLLEDKGVDYVEYAVDALIFEQLLGVDAIAAIAPGIDLHLGSAGLDGLISRGHTST